jgi:hypothetical protein
MTAVLRTTAAGIFTSREEAERAVDELRRAGFPEENIGSRIDMEMPEEEASHYETEVQAGRILVTVKAGARYNEAVAILRRHGALGKGSPLI